MTLILGAMLAAVTFTSPPVAEAHHGEPHGPGFHNFEINQSLFVICAREVRFEALIEVGDFLPVTVDVTAFDPEGVAVASDSAEAANDGDVSIAVGEILLDEDPAVGVWTFDAVVTDDEGLTGTTSATASPGPCDPVIDGFELASEPPGIDCVDQTLTFHIGATDPQADLASATVTMTSPTGDVIIEETTPYSSQGDIMVDIDLPGAAEPGTWAVTITVTDVGGRTDSDTGSVQVPDRDCVPPPTPPAACPSLTGWNASPSASPSLVGWWPFDDATPGGHLADGLGNFAAGTETGGAAGFDPGFLNQAELFDGSSAVDVPGPVGFGIGTQTLTIDLMVRTTDTSGTLIEHRTTGTGVQNIGPGFLLTTWDSSSLLFQTQTNTTGWHGAFLDFPTSLIYDDQWHQITIVRTATATHLFINGTWHDTEGVGNGSLDPANVGLRFGAEEQGNNVDYHRGYDGDLDEVAIWVGCDIDDPVIDLCPDIEGAQTADIDEDGVGDECDNCPTNPNPEQADSK